MPAWDMERHHIGEHLDTRFYGFETNGGMHEPRGHHDHQGGFYGANDEAFEFFIPGNLGGISGGTSLPPSLIVSQQRQQQQQHHQQQLRQQELALLQQYYDSAAGGGAVKRPFDGGAGALVKKARPDEQSAVHPMRPGEKECAFYMKTGGCSFGASCRFHHPGWVPPGGMPGWKEGQSTAPLPERPGESECAFYMRTGTCKYGAKCKYHHPQEHRPSAPGAETKFRMLPQQGASDPSRPWRGFGEGAEFADGHSTAAASGLAAAAAAAVSAAKIALAVDDVEAGRRALVGGAYGTPAPLNSKGLPIRPEELECAFYIKSGSCKYGAACKFNHPEIIGGGAQPVPGGLSQPPVSAGLPDGVDFWLGGAGTAFGQYPERPGQPECAFYLKTGTCKFGPGCRFHHPRVRSGLAANGVVKLTLAGLPRREGEQPCAYYMKTGACRYGPTCKFDHPPPGEAAARAMADVAKKETTQEPDVPGDLPPDSPVANPTAPAASVDEASVKVPSP